MKSKKTNRFLTAKRSRHVYTPSPVLAAILVFILSSQTAMAGNILRKAGAYKNGSMDPMAAAQAAAQAASQSQTAAQAAADQAASPLRRALDSIKQFQAAQNLARQAAQAQQTAIPNGLTPGGLEMAQPTPDNLSPVQGATLLPQTENGVRTQVTVEQDQQKAILTWKTFNVGASTDLYFDQTQGGALANQWIALNRVLDPFAKPSQILGSIKADGQVYIINRNGIIFGGGSQVTVGTLLASTLDFNGADLTARNALFQNGVLSKPNTIIFQQEHLPNTPAQPSIQVEAGAKIDINQNGQAVLCAGEVTNEGSITAIDGQVVLAAGDSASLRQATDRRGYDPWIMTNYVTPDNVTINGVVENSGIVSAPLGKITITANQVKQDGLITATTGADASGAIWIGMDPDNSLPSNPSVTFGPGSVTQVLPDDSGKKVIGTATLTPSTIDVHGQDITLLGGSTIYAPSGDVTIGKNINTPPNENDPNYFLFFNDKTRVFLDSGARIDVSGLRDIEVPMEQNNLQGYLRANELKDNPVLQNSPLRSKKVYFDARLGVTDVADLSGYYNLIERDVKQLMTRGGTLSLYGNEIITKAGSTIDLSGGSLHYLDGYIKDTYLIDPTGKRVAIEQAQAGVAYVGIDGDFVVNHSRWGVTDTYSSGLSPSQPRFEKGYLEGASAGTLIINTNGNDSWNQGSSALPNPDPTPTGAYRIFDGDIITDIVKGPYQREVASESNSTDPTQTWRQQPQGATLKIYRAGDINIADTGPQLGDDFYWNTPFDGKYQRLEYNHLLPLKWFDGKTFNFVTIVSGYTDDRKTASGGISGSYNPAPGGNLTIGKDIVVNLGEGGSFSFTGKSAEIDGTLLAPGGKVKIKTLDIPCTDNSGNSCWITNDPLTTRIGTYGVIDVAGRFTNDLINGQVVPYRALDGGSVSLTAINLYLEAGSLIDVSGGARLDASGKKVTYGDGGSIELNVSAVTSNSLQGGINDGILALAGSLRAYALGAGGKLTLITPYNIYMGYQLPDNANNPYRLITPEFFTQGGFSGYSITGERGLTLVLGTPTEQNIIAPVEEKLLPPTNFSEIQTGARLDDSLEKKVLDDPNLRTPMSLSLSTGPINPIPSLRTLPYDMNLTVRSWAGIHMIPGSTVGLISANKLDVCGTIQIDGGTIELQTKYINNALNSNPQILLEPEAQLLAVGYQKVTPTTGNLSQRSVEPGGTIDILSGATLATNDVLLEPGATINVSGIHGKADLRSAPDNSLMKSDSPLQPVSVDGDAGSISIHANSSGLLASTLSLAPGGERGRGGSLDITAGTMVIREDTDTIDALRNTSMFTVAADRINTSGADNVLLSTIKDPTSSSAIPLLFDLSDGDVALISRESLVLRTGVLGTLGGQINSNVLLSSKYVRLEGVTTSTYPTPPTMSVADLYSTLTVKADLIDLAKTTWLACPVVGTCPYRGFGTTLLKSNGDIRLSDHGTQGDYSTYPGLFTPGALEFDSAQVYVTSRWQLGSFSAAPLERAQDDPGYLLLSNDTITIQSNGNPASLPLSFGERLTLSAPTIVQGGVLRAPQGQIRLEGSDSVELLPGSLTSTSLSTSLGGQIIPFGPVAQGGLFGGYDVAGAVPTKSVTINAPSVHVQQGATVDVSGGGDLLGWAFVAGNGGSKDILSTAGSFAVLPSLGNGPAPIGGNTQLQSSGWQVGDVVWLQNVKGLADGYYTLLPAHYALLPGGLLLQPLGGTYASAPASMTRPDGSIIASGFLASDTDELHNPGYSLFKIMNGETFGKYSDLVTYSFDDSATRLATDAGLQIRTPNDAGTLAIEATNSLSLNGTGKFEAPENALLGNLEISAPKIAVIGVGVSKPADPNYVVLEKDQLENFGSGSVLLGGTRSIAANGVQIDVGASDIVVDTGAGSAWTAPEIILAANNSITVSDGTKIQAQGAVSLDTNSLILHPDILNGYGGAFLRLSTGQRVGIGRVDGSGSVGTLTVKDAGLSAAGSISLDGSSGINLSQHSSLSAPQFDLSSVQVNLGDVAPGQPQPPGTTLGKDLLASLASISQDLLIRGSNYIKIFGDLTLGGRDSSGNATVQKLTLDTGLLQGNAGADATIVASNLTLQNSGPAQTSSISGSGSLTLDSDTLHLGPGQTQINGFGLVNATARTAVQIAGTGGLTITGGGLTLVTDLIHSVSGVSYDLGIEGSADIHDYSRDRSNSADNGLGSRLTISASDLTLDTWIVLPAGRVEAVTGGGPLNLGSLKLGSSASLDVSGQALDFNGQLQFAPGGSVRLASSGDFVMDPKARINVSGSDHGGAAGRIEIAAGGNTSVQGELLGKAIEGFLGGSFTLDAAGLGTTQAPQNFSQINTLLGNGGFTNVRDIRLRNQDITLGAGEIIKAHQVTLQSDSGNIDIAGGTIDASGSAELKDGGTIQLLAGKDLSIEGTANLMAVAKTFSGDFEPSSGKLIVAADGGSVDVATGSTINLSGGRQGGGQVVVRAPRIGDNNIDITNLGATFTGVREILVQGMQDYNATATDIGTVLSQGSAWRTNSLVTLPQKFPNLSNMLQIGAGATIKSDGDLTIADTISLNGSWGPGYLGFIVGGNIYVGSQNANKIYAGSISDGFSSTDPNALISGPSVSLNFECNGDMILQPNSMIRTGSGDIRINVGGDLVFNGLTSPTDRAPVIYVAGAKTNPAIGFNGAPSSMPIGEFPTQGGDISIHAGRDINMYRPFQTTSAWLFRYGDTNWNGDTTSSTVAEQTSWSVMFKNFEQGIGSFGGGNVSIDAGRDITQLQVSIPTTGYLKTAVGYVPNENDLVEQGGGDLNVFAGRDILGGLFMLGRGQANLNAGGSFTASSNPSSEIGLRNSFGSSTLGSSREIGALFGLMDATVNITAGSDIDIEGVYDPMTQGQITENLIGGTIGSAFLGHSERSAFGATSIGGSVSYENDPWASVDLTTQPGIKAAYVVKMGGIGPSDLNVLFSRVTPMFRLSSLESSVNLEDYFGGLSTLSLESSLSGVFDIMANEDVRMSLKIIEMIDLDAKYHQGKLFAFATNKASGDEWVMADGTIVTPGLFNRVDRVYPIGSEPARIYALNGSVCAYQSGQCIPGGQNKSYTPIKINLPISIDIYAGLDVKSGAYTVQNNNPIDYSSIHAGRDIYETSFLVGGQGDAVMEAGRDLILYDGGTTYPQAVFQANGNANNNALSPFTAANLTLRAGIQADPNSRANYQAFANAYLDPDNKQRVPHTYLPELKDYLQKLGKGSISDTDLVAVAAFNKLPEERQKIFLDRVYLTELKESGIDYNDPTSPRYQSYDRGFKAISLLFPNNPADLKPGQGGDVILNANAGNSNNPKGVESKAVETQSQGDITMLAPYGKIEVGSENINSSLGNANTGVVTRRGGDIRMMADENIDLFTSRVFTLEGGDITMWTSNGSITAGSGASTTVLYKPLQFLTDNNAVVTVDAFGLSTGAGIGVLDALEGYDPNRKKSRLDLIAPRGEVNAGDAGIRVIGDINIAARTVAGVENIQVSGSSAGVPKVVAPNIAALTSASQVAQAASKEGIASQSQQSTQSRIEELPSIITVEVVGYETTDEKDKKKK